MRTFSAKGEPLRHYTDGFCGWAIISEAGRIRYEMIETVRNLASIKEGISDGTRKDERLETV